MTTFQVAGKAVATTALTAAPVPARRAASLDLLGPVLELVLAQAAGYLDPPVGRAALYPGLEVAWDDCCSGQLWVRSINVLPSGGRPGAPTPCGVAIWQATIGVGVLRCAATVDDRGRAPTPTQLTAETLQMSADRAALADAISCAITPQVAQLTFLRWDPQGPDGGCVGGEWQFTVKFDNCDCGS